MAWLSGQVLASPPAEHAQLRFFAADVQKVFTEGDAASVFEADKSPVVVLHILRECDVDLSSCGGGVVHMLLVSDPITWPGCPWSADERKTQAEASGRRLQASTQQFIQKACLLQPVHQLLLVVVATAPVSG